jgi:DNA repair protein RadC
MDKLEDSGKGLGIKVLDFIIVGREEFWSWKER